MTKMTKKPKKDFGAAVAASQEEEHRANGSANVVPIRQPIERRRYKTKLPVRIDDAAVATLAEEMATCFEKLDVLEEERRGVMMKFKEKMSGIRDRMNALAANVRSHTVTQQVECMDRLIAETATVECVRLDTGETFDTRAAKAVDLQDTLSFADDVPDSEPEIDGEDTRDTTPPPPAPEEGESAPEVHPEPHEPAWSTGANPGPLDETP